MCVYLTEIAIKEVEHACDTTSASVPRGRTERPGDGDRKSGRKDEKGLEGNEENATEEKKTRDMSQERDEEERGGGKGAKKFRENGDRIGENIWQGDTHLYAKKMKNSKKIMKNSKKNHETKRNIFEKTGKRENGKTGKTEQNGTKRKKRNKWEN